MFRFTIRDVLWLTALVAMGLAWWVGYRQQESALNEMELLRTENENLNFAFRVTGYEIKPGPNGHVFVSRKPEDAEPNP